MHNIQSVLVTGGAGFIGGHFIQQFAKANPGSAIINLDALTYASSTAAIDSLKRIHQHTLVEGSICDAELIAKLLREHNIDTIVHFAAESHVDRSITGPAAFIETNLVGTFHLLEQARLFWLNEKKWSGEQCRFHHVSTDEVYGSLSPDAPAFTEEKAYEPNSPYSASKAGSDHLVRAYHHTYGLPTTVSNCSNNFGPYQHGEKLIPTIIRCCHENRPIPIYGDGKNIRDWLYVEDHCDAIIKILNVGKLGETYNIGANNERSNIEITQWICQIMDELAPHNAPHKKLIEFTTDRPGHDQRYAIDTRKMNTQLDWRATHDFEASLRKTIAFYIDQPA